jgi:hypothetical protein
MELLVYLLISLLTNVYSWERDDARREEKVA